MSFDRPSYSLRAALLGAVALAALGGVAVETSVATVSAAATTAQAGATTAQAPAGPASFADVVDRVKPAVVSVKVKLSDAESVDDEDSDGIPSMPDIPKNSPFYRFFRHFGMPDNNGGADRGNQAPRHHFSQAQGSGFFISGDGYIVTNNHVVDHASEVTVTTAEGKSMSAKVIGVDSKTDLALLKAEGGGFPYVTFAAHTPRVGDWVIAVGNPFGLGGTVTAGIVSARGRDIGSGPYDDFLQIDAPVNHGNSGGPTFNAEGEVVGVNTAIFSPSGGSVGIGFAIASDVVKDVVQQLKGTTGALVAAAQKDSPAAAAGVKSGDVITAVDGETVADPHDLARRIAAMGPKKTVKLALIRNGSPMTIDVTLGTMPADKTANAETPNSDDNGGSALAKLGLTLRAAHGQDGVVVAEVDPDGAAADKGLKQGDVILEVAGKSVNRPAEVVAAIDTAKSDGKKSVLVRVKSNDGEHYLTLPTRAS